MKSLTILLLGILFHLSFFAAKCSAQLVVVRPGYVKAPFVRVYRNPDGSTYVRAPFVRVHSPVRQPQSHYVPRELQSLAADLAEMSWQSLRHVLRQSSADLDAELSRFPTGKVWRRHFMAHAVLDLVPPQGDYPPSDDERTQLIEILTMFDQAHENSDLRAITSLVSFRVLHAAIGEFVSRPEPRMLRA